MENRLRSIIYLREKYKFHERKAHHVEKLLRNKCKLYEKKLSKKNKAIRDIKAKHLDELIDLKLKHCDEILNNKTIYLDEIENIKRKNFVKELKLKSQVELLNSALNDSESFILDQRNDLNKVIYFAISFNLIIQSY